MGAAVFGVVLLVALVAVVLILRSAKRPARLEPERDRRPSTAIAADVAEPEVAVEPEVAAEPEIAVEQAEPQAVADAGEPAITWTAQITAATLDEAARLRLVDDLALLRAAWAVALLRRAHDEEPAPHVRARIGQALAACGAPIETTV